MQALKANYLFTSKGFMADQTLLFDEKIIDYGPHETMIEAYPELEYIETPKHNVVIPGLINSHVHLEFSANTDQLKYGRFLPWLYSVIKQRDTLINECGSACIEDAIEKMILSGTTTFGAVSSYGFEMKPCVQSDARVVFFNEIIGSNPAMADTLWTDFEARLNESKSYQSDRFYPAVAIHSPYSVHPILAQKAISLAKSGHLPLTAHLLESEAERQWLESSSGEFAPFFENFLQQKNSVTTVDEFITLFAQTPTLFTHATELKREEAQRLQKDQHTIIHCPISNRLLGNKLLNIKMLFEEKLPFICGTDGLSSNYSLNLFEELKASLFMHQDAELSTLALSLLHSVTTQAGAALNLPVGAFEKGNFADILIFDTKGECPNSDDIAVHLILQNYALQTILIQGSPYAKH